MVFAKLGPPEIGIIVLGFLMLAAVIYWRIWMGRKGKGEENENPD